MSRTRVSLRQVWIVLLSWLAMVGFDFLLHGGLLAGHYVQESSFLLPPLVAFMRIPAGYASFLILTVLLAWLMLRLQIQGFRDGLAFGLLIGMLIWGSFTVGLWSITTATPQLLVGWFIGQTVELGLGGGVLGSGFGGARLRTLVLRVFTFVLVAFALTVMLQSLGLAPVLHANQVRASSVRHESWQWRCYDNQPTER